MRAERREKAMPVIVYIKKQAVLKLALTIDIAPFYQIVCVYRKQKKRQGTIYTISYKLYTINDLFRRESIAILNQLFATTAI